MQLEEHPKFEEYYHVKNLITDIDEKGEDRPSDDVSVRTVCVLIGKDLFKDVTPPVVRYDSACTAHIGYPSNTAILNDYLLNATSIGGFVSDDSETYEDIIEIEVVADSTDLGTQQMGAALGEIYKECSSPNWDGYDAQPISNAAYFEAMKLISLLPEEYDNPEIIPEPTGEIAFEWYRGKRFVFVISVGGHSLISYAGLFGSSSKIHGSEYLGDTFPSTIAYNISKLLGI